MHGTPRANTTHGVLSMNARVSAYASTCESLARRYAGRNGAEKGDLVQEGLIAVWLTLKAGKTPSAWMIENRMKDWVRYLGRQTPVPYEAFLPLDVYDVLATPA